MDARGVLEAERVATLARIATATAELDAVAAASAGSNLDDEHDPEGATVAFEREQAASLRARSSAQLAAIDAALARVADGSYGICVVCGQPIAAARLETLPATPTCVRCAAATAR